MVSGESTPDVPKVPEKTCTQCGESKPDIAFPFKHRAKNMRHPYCKACVNLARRRKRAADPEAQRAKENAYWAANREKKAAKDKRWRTTHQESLKAYFRLRNITHRNHLARNNRARYLRNRERYKPLYRAWKQANRDKVRASNAKRKALKRGSPVNTLTAQQWTAIKAHFGHACVYCGRKMAHLTIDHIVPISHGGAHTLQNVVPACQSCNSKKHAGPPLNPVQPLLLI